MLGFKMLVSNCSLIVYRTNGFLCAGLYFVAFLNSLFSYKSLIASLGFSTVTHVIYE